MKKITEMSEQEILSLTDEQIDTLIKIRMAEEGIKILNEPQKPEYLPIQTGDVTAYDVEGIDFIFVNQHDAQEASEFILSLKDRLRKESYGQHYELKFLSTDEYGFDRIGQIQPKKFYSRELITQIESAYSANQMLKKDYEKALAEYNQNYDSAQFIRDEIRSRYYEVVAKYQHMERMKAKFNEYLTLAENNAGIAMGFLKKAYTIDDATQKFILSNYAAA